MVWPEVFVPKGFMEGANIIKIKFFLLRSLMCRVDIRGEN